jgi:LacI family transcriptional regulator
LNISYLGLYHLSTPFVMENRKSTIKDIARALGVSTSTVSRALNDKFIKNEAMVALIKQKAEELDYQANSIAAGLRTQKSNLIGIVVPRIATSFFSGVLSGLQSVLNEKGYYVLICQSNESKVLEESQVNSLVRSNVEGLIISCAMETHNEDFFKKVTSKGIKVVYIDRQNFETESPIVKVDDVKGSYLATEHLIKNGAKSLMFLGGPEMLSVSKDRYFGFVKAMEQYNLEPVGYSFCNNKEAVEKAISTVIEKKIKTDGIVAWSDEWAVSAILKLQKNGFKVPEDVMVTGYDNNDICEIVNPTLTSVLHDPQSIGKCAAETLYNLIEGQQVKPVNLLETRLIIRGSSKKSS